jgi:hypothetical protein
MGYSPIEIKGKAGNLAISIRETLSFPTPPRDGCGFVNFPFLSGKQGTCVLNQHNLISSIIKYFELFFKSMSQFFGLGSKFGQLIYAWRSQ